MFLLLLKSCTYPVETCRCRSLSLESSSCPHSKLWTLIMEQKTGKKKLTVLHAQTDTSLELVNIENHKNHNDRATHC